MSGALCLHCGTLRNGMLELCPECEQASTGDLYLDLAFSEQCLTRQTLEACGAALRALQPLCEKELRLWVFLQYLAEQQPDYLGVNLPPELRGRCLEVLTQAHLPPLQLEKVQQVVPDTEHTAPEEV